MELRTGTVTLTVPDGSMPAYLCRPATGGPFPAVIVVMKAFDLNRHIKDVTERVAREGYVSRAPDLYHRFGSPIAPTKIFRKRSITYSGSRTLGSWLRSAQ
ncbi:MAG: dienelactone hydrolase family protein [Candidatus Methylomirabilia bacterium]